jgi:hypothetical protein
MLFLLASIACICRAGVDFTPHPGYPAPNYFSGTNARAFYSAMPTFPDDHFDEGILLLNDEEVIHRYYVPPPGTTVANGDSMAVMFDSNHFEHLTDVEVKMKVRIGSQWYEHTYSAPAKNKAVLMGLDYLDGSSNVSYWGCRTARDWLTNTGYENLIRYDLWTPGDLAYEINEDVNYFMFAGHGNAATIWSGEHITQNPPGNWFGNEVYAEPSNNLPNILDMLESKMGNIHPSPPYNDTGRPPFNVVFLLTCDAAMGNDFMSFLYPYINEHGGFLENQAVCGFTEKVDLLHYQFLSDKFHASLVAGFSAQESLFRMVAKANESGYVTFDGGIYDQSVVRVIGDDWATIKNVYNPGHRLVTWHKEIPIP